MTHCPPWVRHRPITSRQDRRRKAASVGALREILTDMTDTPQWPGRSSGPFSHGAGGPQPPYGPQASQAVPAPDGVQGGVGWQNPPGVGGAPGQPAQPPYLPAGAPVPYQTGPVYPAAPGEGAPKRRRHTAVIVTVVVVLVLAVAGGGAAYCWLRGRDGKPASLWT